MRPIEIKKEQRTEFMQALLKASGILDNSGEQKLTVRELAECLSSSFILRKTAGNSQGINRKSIETELYTLIKTEKEKKS